MVSLTSLLDLHRPLHQMARGYTYHRHHHYAQAFVSQWIPRFGVPTTITTDRGSQFESNLWKEIMNLLGSRRTRTTVYHPQANGMVERFHRQLKAALKTLPDPSSWFESLPLVLLGIRTSIKEDLQASAAEMVYGTTLRLPGEFFSSSSTSSSMDPTNYASRLKAHMNQLQPTSPRQTHTNTRQVSKLLSTCKHVFVRCDSVRKPLQPPYNGPYRILNRTDKYYTIDIAGRKDNALIDCLKPAHLDLCDPSPNTITSLPLPPKPTTTKTIHPLLSDPPLLPQPSILPPDSDDTCIGLRDSLTTCETRGGVV